MNAAPLPRNHYPALDGLRGLAILLVIACHNFNFIPYFEFGWVGVDLFFVLSGFLITDILLRTRGTEGYLRNFYIRRILRIFPLYYGVLILFFLVTPRVAPLQVQFEYYHHTPSLAWLHLQNWLYIAHIPPNDLMLMGHFWSLSVEEQFYLVWPFVVLFAATAKRLRYFIYGLLAACVLLRLGSWFYFGDGYTNFQTQFMTRIDGLCVGSLVATWRLQDSAAATRKIFRFTGTVLLFHLLVMLVAKIGFPGFPHFRFLGYTSLAALFGCFVIVASNATSRRQLSWLQTPFLTYMGRISYGLYVFHWPALTLSKILFLDRLTQNGWSYDTAYSLLSVVALVVAVIISILSYHFFEKRMLALKDVLTSDRLLSRLRERINSLVKPASAR